MKPLPYGWVIPNSVDELLTRLNEHGGVCYQEHADLIRAYLDAQKPKANFRGLRGINKGH